MKNAIKTALFSSLIFFMTACQQNQESADTTVKESTTDCEKTAQEAKKAMETSSGVAFDLSGKNQSAGCSTEKSEPSFEP